jgi:ribokinase
VIGTVTSDGEKRTCALGGANLLLGDHDATAFEAVLAAADVVLVQLEPPPSVVHRVLSTAREAGVPALLDIAPAQGPVRDLFPLATWVTGNRSELEVSTGVAVHDESTAREAAAVVLARGPSIAGVTAGAAGQLVAWAEGSSWTVPDRSAEVVDTAGAGDAFAATLGVLLAEGMPPADAARRAGIASTLACRELGALEGLATRDELEERAR